MESQIIHFNHSCGYGGLDVLYATLSKETSTKRMESLNKLQKGYEVITIGGLYGTVDEVDTEKKTIVLDVDGVYLTFELAAIKTVLPLKETASLEGAIEK